MAVQTVLDGRNAVSAKAHHAAELLAPLGYSLPACCWVIMKVSKVYSAI